MLKNFERSSKFSRARLIFPTGEQGPYVTLNRAAHRSFRQSMELNSQQPRLSEKKKAPFMYNFLLRRLLTNPPPPPPTFKYLPTPLKRLRLLSCLANALMCAYARQEVVHLHFDIYNWRFAAWQRNFSRLEPQLYIVTIDLYYHYHCGRVKIEAPPPHLLPRLLLF